MTFAKINDMKIFYEQQGSGDNLVLIAGLGSNHKVWDGLMPPLLNKYKVLRFDNRGSGQSDSPNVAYTLQDMTDDAIKLMNHLNIDQSHIVGHSMGCAILQHLLLDYPNRVKKAIFCGGFARLPETTSFQCQTTAKLIEANVNRSLIIETVIPWLFANEYLSNKDRVKITCKLMLDDPHPPTTIGYRGQVEALIKFDLREKLKSIKAEAMVVVGRDDISTPISCSQYIHEQIKNSKLQIIENAGHLCLIEYPEKLSKIITDFIG